MGKVSDLALAAAGPLIEEMGYEIVDAEYVSEHKQWYLNFYIDKPGGVTVDDCERVSNAIDPVLDAADPTAGAPYILCVSSPGLDRPLKTEKDFRRVLGQRLEVRLYQPMDGRKQLEGVLTGCSADGIVLDCDGTERALPLSRIALARLYIDFGGITE